MSSLLINEDKTIWLALIVSVLIHGLLFTFSGKTFIQHAQYSVETSAQTVEVSIEEIKNSSAVLHANAGPLLSVVPSETKPRLGRAASSIRIKANPNYFQNPSPEYPQLAKQLRQEGVVMLSINVNKQGDPVNIEMMQSSGYHLLDQAALKAVRHWKFQPGSVGNIPVESTVTVPIRFRLEK